MHTNQNSFLLLTWGTGHGAQDDKAARSARAAKGAATRRKNKASALRAERVARFQRDGGTLLPSGPVMLLWLATTPRLRDAERLANASEKERADARRADRERGALAAQAAFRLKLAGVRGAERAQAERAAGHGIAAPALAYIGATRASQATLETGEAGTLETRLAVERLASDASEPNSVSGAERRALRRAKRSKGRAERALPINLRPVHALGALDASRADIKVEGSARLVDKLTLLANASAGHFARQWEAQGGRPASPSDVEEFACLYRARFARAATLSGLVPPDARSLFQRGQNPLPFRALLAWQRAYRGAGTECRSYLWGKGWEKCDVVSPDELHRSRAVMLGADDERCYTVSSARTIQQEAPLEGEIEQEARAEREAGVRGAYIRRLCARWGDFIRAYWMLSGSRKWRNSLASDLQLLARAARVARGAGVELLGEYLGEGDATKGSLREAASQLRKRIAAGRILATDSATIEAADAVLEASKAARATMRAAGVRVAARQRAERLALEVVCSAN